MTELIITEKCSYFGEQGLIEVEVGLTKVPEDVANYFIKIGTARYPDNYKPKGKPE